MTRFLIGLGVGLLVAVLSLGAYLALDGAGDPSESDIEVAVLKHEEGNFKDARCVKRKYPNHFWDCTFVSAGGFTVEFTRQVAIRNGEIEFVGEREVVR